MSESEDAARYRWLAAQFELRTEGHERDVLVGHSGNRKTYETRMEYWHSYQLRDDWRFGEHSDREKAATFEELVDALMKERSHQP